MLQFWLRNRLGAWGMIARVACGRAWMNERGPRSDELADTSDASEIASAIDLESRYTRPRAGSGGARAVVECIGPLREAPAALCTLMTWRRPSKSVNALALFALRVSPRRWCSSGHAITSLRAKLSRHWEHERIGVRNPWTPVARRSTTAIKGRTSAK